MIIQTFIMAIKAIFSNKIRSFLTMLGIIVGVLSVVVLVGIGQGTTASVSDSISSMGTNMLTVNVGTRGGSMDPRQKNNKQTASSAVGTVVLREEEVLALKENESIEYISPTVSGSLTVKAGNTNESINCIGVYPDYMNICNQSLLSGRYINSIDEDNRSAVCVVGPETAVNLFGYEDISGESIKIEGQTFLVIGVLESKGDTSAGSSDDVIQIPFSIAQRILKNTDISTFLVSAASAEEVNSAQNAVEQYLYKRFQNTDSYSVYNQTEMLDTISETTETMTMMLGGIAAISLLVGGIGIMNIMLVSVSERTREIGIRKAIGAKKKHILSQFLIEAIIISGIGGLLGLLGGIFLMRFLTNVLDMPTVFSYTVVYLAIGFSMAVGIVFGIYPAAKAANLRPIEALRYE